MQNQSVMDSWLRPHVQHPSVSSHVDRISVQHPSVSPHVDVDRMSSLPDDLLFRILSRLSTKDAAVMTVLSKKMRSLFPWMTTLDFHDSPISHCLKSPYQLHRVQTFKLFVDSVLKASLSPHLTRFSLRFGGTLLTRYTDGCNPVKHCEEDCFPHMDPSHLNAWISFPLTRTWIKEIDLCIHIRNYCQLPPQLFTCQALEVLKLDVSLDLSLVSNLPTFLLPNLKVFHLNAINFNLGDIVSRIVSSCPLLEEVDVYGWWVLADYITISSPSLRTLHIFINNDDSCASKLVIIDTPNLQYFSYADDLASSYSITPMNALVDAAIDISNANQNPERSFPVILSLVRAAHNVQRLSLECLSVETLGLGNLKDQLPVFYNLRHLDLARGCVPKWNKVLLHLLHRSPVLERLVFPEGLVTGPAPLSMDREPAELERQYFSTSQEIPWCCGSSLKRIEIETYWGTERELELVKFLLRSASVLEELVISECRVNKLSLERKLTQLPRASWACSIQVR
ncbi:F-box/LRR-repeat protein At4g14103-like [Silene latifolia]|uniref:F-box/LRR-repeat protein At4g14103-like n=1 Tax=Silene latifolia TaxID=37657 RepID=UPI003D76FC92